MITYGAIFIAISALYFITWRINKFKSIFLLVAFITLIIVASTRGATVGVDTLDYLGFFENTSLNGLDLDGINLSILFIPAGFEIGFKLYTYVLSTISTSFTFYLFISSMLIYLPIYFFIKRYSPNYYLSFVIYYCLFFFGSMSMLRQSIAMSIIILGTSFIVRRNLVKYLAIVLLASSFHITALIGIILYPIYNKRLSKQSAAFIIILAGIIFATLNAIIKFAATINPRYDFYIERINTYSIASFMALGLYLLIFVILLTLYNSSMVTRKYDINRSFLLITSFLAMIIIGLSIKVNSLDRLSLFFLIYTVISIPIFMYNNKNYRYVRYVKILIIFVLISYATIILLIKPEWYGVTDYNTYNTTLGVRAE